MTTPHPLDERCFYCATDQELLAVMYHRPGSPVIRMDTPEHDCPRQQPTVPPPTGETP